METDWDRNVKVIEIDRDAPLVELRIVSGFGGKCLLGGEVHTNSLLRSQPLPPAGPSGCFMAHNAPAPISFQNEHPGYKPGTRAPRQWPPRSDRTSEGSPLYATREKRSPRR